MNDEDLKAYGEDVAQRVADLMSADPSLHYVTATIIAGDLISADKATAAVKSGEMTAVDALVHVGSYARFDWAVTMMEAGLISEEDFYSRLPSLWSGSDPDDTTVRYLNLWERAWLRNGGRTVTDGKPLPSTGGRLIVYRGGSPFNVRIGFAWSLNPKVARGFANGADQRTPRVNGVVVRGEVERKDVLAYLTGRGESEVIIDPRKVKNIHPTGAGL